MPLSEQQQERPDISQTEAKSKAIATSDPYRRSTLFRIVLRNTKLLTA